MTIKQIRALTGLSQAKFGKKYDIPLNTIKNWECDLDKPNHRDCPVYVFKLLERAVKEDFDVNEPCKQLCTGVSIQKMSL